MTQRMLASAEWLLLAVALVWGTSYGVAKLALEHYPVYGVLAVRFILAGLCLLPALRTTPWQAWRVALLMGSEPVFGALFAWLWLGEAMGPLRWLGGGLMAVAAVMATGGGSKVEKGVGEKEEIRFT